jgi:hypothetical protein
VPTLFEEDRASKAVYAQRAKSVSRQPLIFFAPKLKKRVHMICDKHVMLYFLYHALVAR